MLCLNMIVRNEMANLERCLNALADDIDCWVIGDTGSTDGTQDFIKSFYRRTQEAGRVARLTVAQLGKQAVKSAAERCDPGNTSGRSFPTVARL
jgi:hypothetical protein